MDATQTEMKNFIVDCKRFATIKNCVQHNPYKNYNFLSGVIEWKDAWMYVY